MRILATIVLLTIALLTVPSAKAQVQHVGGMSNAQFEGKGSGNGNIAGGEIQHIHRFGDLVLKDNVQVTRDLKGYLDRYGVAFRWHTRARYYFPVGKDDRVYISGGVNASHFSIADSAKAKDGYKKWTVAPVAGAGFEVGKPESLNLVIGYDYQFRTQLKASAYSGGATIQDGWTRAHVAGVEATAPIKKSKWLFLGNASYGISIYERNPAVYGNAIAGVKYRFNYTEFSIGIGRRY